MAKCCGKRRAGEIAGDHALGVALHLRARGDASLNRVQHEIHVEPGLLGDGKPLGEAGDLDRAHQIIDQLVDGAAPTAPKWRMVEPIGVR